MKKQSFGLPCPVAKTLETVADPWSLLIVRDALLGRSRFGEFQRSLDIARNILSDRLAKLVEQGVLETVPIAGSRHAGYRLTAKGRDLAPVILALYDWGMQWAPPADPAQVEQLRRLRRRARQLEAAGR